MSEHEHNSETQYSPEARDMVFTIPNLISVLRIISIPIILVVWFSWRWVKPSVIRRRREFELNVEHTYVPRNEDPGTNLPTE